MTAFALLLTLAGFLRSRDRVLPGPCGVLPARAGAFPAVIRARRAWWPSLHERDNRSPASCTENFPRADSIRRPDVMIRAPGTCTAALPPLVRPPMRTARPSSSRTSTAPGPAARAGRRSKRPSWRDRIENRFCFDHAKIPVAFVEGSLEPVECRSYLAECQMHQGHRKGRDVTGPDSAAKIASPGRLSVD